MLVEFKRVSVSGLDLGPVNVNPRHVILVQRAVNSSDPDAQAFTTELTVEQVGQVIVEGSTTEVRQKLNVGGLR